MTTKIEDLRARAHELHSEIGRVDTELTGVGIAQKLFDNLQRELRGLKMRHTVILIEIEEEKGQWREEGERREP